MSSTIPKCPLCNGRIQATIRQYTDNVTLNADGDVVSYGDDSGVDQSVVYCENDHDHEQIIEALNAANVAG